MRPPPRDQHTTIRFNMTPMIDVVFLLIIFFLVSSHLARQETQFDLSLPTAASGNDALDDTHPRVTINVAPDGRVVLAGGTLPLVELESRLRYELSHVGPDLEVRVRGDRRVPYSRIEPILLACARVGIWRVTFAVHHRDESS